LLGHGFPENGDDGDLAGQHDAVQAGQELRVDPGGGRVVWVGEDNRGGQGGGHQIAVTRGAAGTLVGALGQVLAVTGSAGAVLG
jgi:hypothetical protein